MNMQKNPSSTVVIVDVAIIGAGMAGLRAAQVLQEELIEHDDDDDKRSVVLTILEGRHIAGGRIRWNTLDNNSHLGKNTTTDNTPLYIDEGAQFIHGLSKQNPLVKLAHKHQIRYRKIDWDDGYALVGKDRLELPRAVERKEERIIEKIKQQLATWQKNQVESAAGSAVNDVALHSVLETFVNEHCGKDASLSATRLWTHLRMEIQDDYAADLDHLSALYFDQDDVLGHGDAVPHTYQRLLEAMLPEVDNDDSIMRYHHNVKRLDFPTDPKDLVCILCQRTDTDQVVEIKARRVICTLPLGVLKRHTSTNFFTPPLPSNLQASIQRLGYGCLEKIWLSFECPPFWPTDADAFYQVATADTPFRTWFLPARVYRNATYERTLCCFVSGTAARALAECNSEEVAAQALQALQQILSVPDDVVIRDVRLTRWSTDRWSGNGSYSHLALSGTADDYRVFESSFYHDRLWFAGEATSVEYPGTVHGAYLSGERAARACCQML